MSTSSPDTETTITDAAPSESLGAWLHRSRCERGLDLEQTARRLRTKTAVVQALENDNFKALGAPVFIRMYLVRYAELLGLPEHEVMGRFKALGIDQPPPLRVSHPVQSQTRASDLRWLAYPAVFALVGWLGWTISQQQSELSETSAPMATDTTTPEVATSDLPTAAPKTPEPPAAEPAIPDRTSFVPDDADQAVASSPESSSPADETVTLAALDKQPVGEQALDALPAPVEPTDGASGGTLQPAGSASVPDEPSERPPDQSRLALAFSADCWVDIRDAQGNRLAYGLLGPDDGRTLTGAAPFSITLGNAPAVELSLNGQPVERQVYLPERGTVSRFKLDLPSRG